MLLKIYWTAHTVQQLGVSSGVINGTGISSALQQYNQAQALLLQQSMTASVAAGAAAASTAHPDEPYSYNNDLAEITYPYFQRYMSNLKGNASDAYNYLYPLLIGNSQNSTPTSNEMTAIPNAGVSISTGSPVPDLSWIPTNT